MWVIESRRRPPVAFSGDRGDFALGGGRAPRHAWASSGLGARINPQFNYGDGDPGGWWIVDEPELHLGEDILVPDLAG